MCIRDSFEKESDRLKAIGRASAWYSILPKLNDEQAKQWTVNELEPDSSVEDLAEKLATHFTSITNQAQSFTFDMIPRSDAAAILIPQLLERTVADRIKKYKKTF